MNKDSLKISLFYCSGSINPSELMASEILNKQYHISTISLPCSGRINIQYLLKAIEKGADGAILLTCPVSACNYVEGNLRAAKRVMAVNSILIESGFKEEKIKLIQTDAKDGLKEITNKVIKACNTFSEKSQLEIV